VVPGRPLRAGDVAIVDFNVTRLDTGEAIAGSERRGMQLDTGLGDRAIGLAGACAPRLRMHAAPGIWSSSLSALAVYASAMSPP
jgi:hypothetical protein